MQANMTTVDLQEFQQAIGELVDRAERGEVVTITKDGQPAAHLVPAGSARPTGAIRPGDGSRHLPTPIMLQGSGRSAVSYVAENRR